MSSISKKKISKEEVEKRLAMNKTTAELEKIKKEMKAASIEGKDESFTPDPTAFPLQSLHSAGRNQEDAYWEAVKEWNNFLKLLSEYIFGGDRWQSFFPNNKINYLITALKRAKMEMLAFSIMDIFKSRVKQRNGNKIPTIKEKSGIFGKTTTRYMKPEEIAKKYEIEDDIPNDDDKPLTIVGTKNGIIKYLQETLFENEEVQDPIKKGPRKSIAYFLQSVKLVDTQTQDTEERQFLACLLTPEKLMPKNRDDVDGLTRLTSLFKKGNHWLEKKINEQQANHSASDKENQHAKEQAAQ